MKPSTVAHVTADLSLFAIVGGVPAYLDAQGWATWPAIGVGVALMVPWILVLAGVLHVLRTRFPDVYDAIKVRPPTAPRKAT